MKLHDLRPPDGSNTARTRVGRGIAAGKGKTAGRGTKGQKARAGGSIPPWFEGGQTPLHMRIPKLRGFKNRAKIHYEVVNVGDIAARIEAGAFAEAGTAPKKGEQLTINADILRAVGLVRNVKKPLKILGNGELASALFVVADAFTKSATAKIEAAGGVTTILEVPTETLPALGLDADGVAIERTPRVARTAAGREAADRKVDARARRDADTADAAAEAATVAAEKATKPEKPKKAKAVDARTEDADAATATNEPAAAAADADEPAATAETAETPAIEAPDVADVGATENASDSGADEPADAPDAVADDAAESEPVTGDDAGDEGTKPTGDESA
jgi:large subunit ribosomal protein L15